MMAYNLISGFSALIPEMYCSDCAVVVPPACLYLSLHYTSERTETGVNWFRVRFRGSGSGSIAKKTYLVGGAAGRVDIP